MKIEYTYKTEEGNNVKVIRETDYVKNIFDEIDRQCENMRRDFADMRFKLQSFKVTE